jgi:hypothetical protein
MTKLTIPALLFLFPLLVVAQVSPSGKHPGKQPLAHTYSIVARDPETGQLGVAVQSHWFSVVNAKKIEEALPLFRRVFAADRNWAILIPRLPKSKMLPDDQQIISRILSVETAGNR